MAVERTRTPDTGAETADKPQNEKPPPLPADRPGGPGQPSRLESRAAAQAPEKNASRPSDKPGTAPEGKPTSRQQHIPTPVNWSPRRASREAAAQPQDTPATPPPPVTAPDNWSPRRESREAARDTQATSPSPKPENEDKQPSTATENTEGSRRTSNDATTSATAPADRQPSPGSTSTADTSPPERPEAASTEDARTKPDATDQPSSQPAADSPPSPAERSKPKADERTNDTHESNTDALGQTRDVTDPNKSGPKDVTTDEEPTKNAEAQPTTDAVSADIETPHDASTWPTALESRQPEPTSPEEHGLPKRYEQAPAELQEIEARARAVGERYGVDINFTDHPIHPDCARLLTEVIEKVSEEYPSVFKGLDEIRVLNLSEMQLRHPLATNDVIGYSTPKEVYPPPHGIYLNQHWYANKDFFEDRARLAESQGFLVPNGGYADGIFYHEFGHHIGRKIMNDPIKSKEVGHTLRDAAGKGNWDISLAGLGFPTEKNIITNNLSKYGSTNPSEMLAEIFAEWKASPNPRPLATAVGKLMDTYFKEVNS